MPEAGPAHRTGQDALRAALQHSLLLHPARHRPVHPRRTAAGTDARRNMRVDERLRLPGGLSHIQARCGRVHSLEGWRRAG